MSANRWLCVDRDGWPVETFKHRRFLSFVRLLLHTARVVRAERCVLCGGWIPVTMTHDCSCDSVGTAAYEEPK